MKHLPDLILASTSRYRRALLERLRIPFETVAPAWDEVRANSPDETVRTNALARREPPQPSKRCRDPRERPGRMVRRQNLEKRGRRDRMRATAWLAGRAHTLHTCVALRMPDVGSAP